MENNTTPALRKRFAKYVMKNWIMNDHNLKNISCVYAIISMDFPLFAQKYNIDIAYVGSTTQLFSRYKSHKIPAKIQAMKKINLLYYLPLNKGFYDYEIKLIRRLQPCFNKQHKF